MTTFRFRLDTVRDLRVEEERERAVELARSRKNVRDAEQAHEDLEQIRDAGRRCLERAHGDRRTVGQLQNLTIILEGLHARAEAARCRAEKAREESRECLEEFREAHQARRTMDRLREHHLESWRVEQGRIEQKETDEVAVLRHARSEPLERGQERPGSGRRP